MLKKKTFWIVAVLLAGGIIWFFSSRGKNVEYTTEVVHRGDLFKTVSVTGSLESKTGAKLSFVSGGKIDKILVKVGDKVRKGQTLAYLDQQETLSLYRQYQTEVVIQEEALDLARRHWDDLSPEEKKVKKLAVQKAKEVRDGAYANMKKTIIQAPFDGEISKVDIREGENISSNAIAIELNADSELQIEADVPESDISEVSLGQSAEISFDALPSDDKFEAKVFLIESSATVIQDVVYYRIKLSLEKQDVRLKAGMSSDIDIRTDERRDVLIVPERSVKSENGKKFVEILNKENQVEKKFIEIGLSGDDGLVEIKSGLGEGEAVISFTKEN